MTGTSNKFMAAIPSVDSLLRTKHGKILIKKYGRKSVVDAIRIAAESDIKGEIINIGSDNTYSLNKLVDLLGGDVVYIPKRPGEPDCTWGDISKAKKLLNWQPEVSFEKGVRILLENIDYWCEAPVWDKNSIAKATEKWFEYLS